MTSRQCFGTVVVGWATDRGIQPVTSWMLVCWWTWFD